MNMYEHDTDLQNELNCRIFVRKLILWLFYFKQMNPEQISNFTGLQKSTIYYDLNKWKFDRTTDDASRTGRPVQLPEKIANLIIEKQLEDRTKTGKAIFQEMQEDAFGKGEKVDFTYRQTNYHLNKNFEVRNAPYVIQLSEKNRLKRVQFCEKYMNWRQTKWETIVWTDEKIFRMCHQGKKIQVKLLPNEDVNDFARPKKQQGGGGVMFWSCISLKVGKIYIAELEGNFNSQKFAIFLQKQAIPEIIQNHGQVFILQQDNARAHKGKTSLFLEKSGINWLDWPPQSPDINPVE